VEQKIRGGQADLGSLQRFLQDTSRKARGRPPRRAWTSFSLFVQGHPHFHFTVVNQDFSILADSQPEQVGRSADPVWRRPWLPGKILAHGAGSEESFSLMKKRPFWSPQPASGDRTVGGIRAEIPLETEGDALSDPRVIIFLYVFLTALSSDRNGELSPLRVIINPLKKLMQMSEKIARKPGIDERAFGRG